MKSFLFALLISSSVATFANDAKTCFSAVSEVPFFLPSRICFDSLKLSADQKTVNIVSEESTLPKALKVISLVTREDENLLFKAKELFAYSGTRPCEEFYTADISMVGSSKIDGSVDLGTLAIGIDYTYKVDLCHSSGESHSITYLKE